MTFDALKQTSQKLAQNPQISRENKKAINQFINHHIEKDNKEPTIQKHVSSFNQISNHLDFQLLEADQQTLKQFIRDLNRDQITKQNQEKYSEISKIGIRKTLKQFYKSQGMDDQIEWLSVNPNSHNPKVKPDQLLKPRHIKKILENTEGTRNKALIWTLWSSGSRIGGLVKTKYPSSSPLKWEDVRFNTEKKIVKLDIQDKTGDPNSSGPRTVPVRQAYPALKKLRDQTDPDLDDYVFKKKKSGGYGTGPLTDKAVRSLLNRIRGETDIPERIKTNPHAWRKSLATFKASIGWNQAQLCTFFGWVQGSKEAAKYIRLAEQDLEKALLKEYGEDSASDMDEDLLKPVRCGGCGEINSVEWSFCQECGEELDIEFKLHNDSTDKRETDIKRQKYVAQLEKLIDLAESMDISTEEVLEQHDK